MLSDVNMISRLLEFIASLTPEKVATISLQDIALGRTWYRANITTSGVAEQYVFLPKAVAAWGASQLLPVGAQQGEQSPTEARRTQWLLRDLIDQLKQSGVPSLQPDELLFIDQVYDLATHAAAPQRFERVRGLLQPFIEAIQTCLKNVLIPNDLPSVSRRIVFANQEDLEKSRPREIKVFCGIEMPSLGPVFTAQGHLKIFGSVPENCTVVVDGGCCCVEGYILGKVAATRHCDVRENISGVVIVRQGDIRARNIIDKAYVVSKQGRVICRRVQNPNLIFAGVEIRVRDHALLGTLMSPRIRIDGDARGGTYHGTRTIAAQRFCNTASAHARIVLRRELSCIDYGEALSDDAVRLIKRQRLLKYRIKDLSRLLRQNMEEAESLAASTIFYLMTPGDVQKTVEKHQAAERRLAVLLRLMQGLQVLAFAAEEKLVPSGKVSRPNLVSPQDNILQEEGSGSVSSYKDISNEIRLFADQEEQDRDLESAVEEMRQIRDKLDQQIQDKKLTSLLLKRVRSRVDGYLEEIQKLRAVVNAYRKECAAALKFFPEAPNGDRPKSMLPTLQRLRNDPRCAEKNPQLSARMETNFIQMMWRKIEQHIRLGKQYKETMDSAEAELTRIDEELRKNYQLVSLDAEKGQESLPTVTGIFERNVLISADPFLFDESDTSEGTVFHVPDSVERIRTYTRTVSGTIVEQT